MFNPFTNENLNDMGLTRDPFENLKRLKQAMKCACMDVKHYSKMQKRPTTIAEKLYWSALLWRSVRSGSMAAACRAVEAFPLLEAYFSKDDHHLFDLEGLTLHINTLAGQDIEIELEELEEMKIPSSAKSMAADRLMARQKLWKSSGRAIILQGVYDAGGRAASGDEAAQLLANHWSAVFDEQQGSSEHYELLENFVQQANSLGQWQVSQLELEELLPRLRASAPGPDGIRYLAYYNTTDTSTPILYDVYMAILSGLAPPSDFNHGLLAFLPKGDDPSDSSPSPTRSPEHTRPLTIANCDQKIVSKLIDIPLSRQVAHSVASVQSGFVKGRKLQDAIFSIEGAGIKSTWHDPKHPAMSFADQSQRTSSGSRS